MKKLICIGGGHIPRYKDGKLLPYETKEIDQEIVKLANQQNPKFLFISIASSHPDEYYDAIKQVYEKLGCIVSHLDIDKPYDELASIILNTDIVYIGGGNTEYLMQQLKNTRIDQLLIKAYQQGIVCAGLSAGSYCWFKCNYNLIKGMNVINAVNCAHYNQKDVTAKNKLYNIVKNEHLIGYAIDDQVALAFIDNNIKIIKSNFQRNAYKITFDNGKIVEGKII